MGTVQCSPVTILADFFAKFEDRKGTTKKLCDKDFTERSGELSGAICLKTLVLLCNELFRKFFGAVRVIFWLCGVILGDLRATFFVREMLEGFLLPRVEFATGQNRPDVHKSF